MKFKPFLVYLFIFFLLTACESPFAQVVLAPESAQVLNMPNELPLTLKNKYFPWYGSLLNLDGSKTAYPKNAVGFIRLSGDEKKMTYSANPVIAQDSNLPKVEDSTIIVYDLQKQDNRILVSKNLQFPDAVSLNTPSFTSDASGVVFLIDWKNKTDLAQADVQSGKVRRLNVNVTLTNFGMPDISKDGKIAVICKGPNQEKPSSELCLLNANGKFIRYLTAEEYPWPGFGRFTPDGQYLIYESRFNLYKVRVDGSERREIAPCSALLGAQAVTEDYAVTACYVSQNPDCYALFIASLDGTDFRRIGYIEPHCVSEKK